MTHYVDETRPHLGGYIEGGDDATYYPELWKWLVQEHNIGSVLDIGCGEGHTLKVFREQGCRVHGVDGIAQDDPDIELHDYTQGPLPFVEPYDLAWCCEFVEHVEERYVPNFMASFRSSSIVMMTHGEPGQHGWHHVNCQLTEYWIGAMAAYGFRHDTVLTSTARSFAYKNRSPWNHFIRSGLVFRSTRAL